jgi:hypothetical protein
MELGTILYMDVVTSDPATGNVMDADELPTADVFENDSPTPMMSVTMTKRGDNTGDYYAEIDVTEGNGFRETYCYNVICNALVGGISGKLVISNFIIDGMTKLKVASELDYTDPPSTFAPDMSSDPAPEVVDDLNTHFGPTSDYANKVIFQNHYNLDLNEWDTADTDAISTEIRDEVAAYLVTYNAYLAEKKEWDIQYEVQKVVQWRSRVAAHLIDWTNSHES